MEYYVYITYILKCNYNKLKPGKYNYLLVFIKIKKHNSWIIIRKRCCQIIIIIVMKTGQTIATHTHTRIFLSMRTLFNLI